MAVFKCKMCGATLEITEGATICECDYCGTTQTIPRLSDDRKANLYDRANHFRRNNDFDKAMSIYENILNEDPTDAEAYWSLVLCRYGIEYVEDPASHKRIPTVNRAQYTSIYADENYKAALEHADALQKTIYEQEAKAIDEIQKGILEISAKEEPFDIFICYKETDSNGRRTQDSVLANDLYHQLTQEGFKVFFSRITLEDKLGVAYEPYIFAALNSAKVMVALGTRPEYFSAVWVKNEWSRYLALIKSGQKKMLIPAYRDMDPYDLPEEFSHLQAQDMSKLGFMQDLIRGIKKIMEADAPMPQKETVVIQQNTGANSNVQALLKRGQMALEDREWEKADGFFEEVLNQDAENGEAYLGKFLAEKKATNLDSYRFALTYKTKDAKAETLTACPEETAHIEEKAEELQVIGARNKVAYLSRDQIKGYYKFDRTYSSEEKDRKEQKEKILSELRRERLYSRVKQYVKGTTGEEVTKFEEKLNEELDERIKEAAEKAAESKEEVIAAYKAHIDSADQMATEAHEQAVGRKEYTYQKACSLAASGEIRPASEAFYKLGDYKDSAIRKKELDERIAQEDREAEARRIENAKREKAKAVRNGIITGTVIIAAIVFLVVLVKVIIPGQKFKGLIKDLKNDANTVSFGKYNNSEIEWIVLERSEDRVLVISKHILDVKQYHSSHTSTTWAECSLRSWLNNEFVDTAFSKKEQGLICETKVDNKDNPEYGTFGGVSTADQVFLLSIDEVDKYFTNNKERIATEVGAASGSWWWLRSPGHGSRLAASVNRGGSVDSYGCDVDYSYGIRPALWIDISNLE